MFSALFDWLLGAGREFDLDAVRNGTLSPVFFGSALTNFGVEPFLRAAVCADVFRERGLLQSLRQGDSIQLHLTGQGKKVALDRSEYLLRLHQALDAAKGGGRS